MKISADCRARSITTFASATTCSEWTVVAIGVVRRRLCRARGRCRARDRRSRRPCRCARRARVTATQPTTQKSSLGMSSKPIGSPCCRKPCAVAAVSKSTPSGGELVGIDLEIGKALGQVGHRREQQLAVVERPEPHGDLRRVGIAFDDARPLPGVELAQPLGGGVGADEIGNAVENRADVDAASLDQPSAHTSLLRPHGLRLASCARPARFGPRADRAVAAFSGSKRRRSARRRRPRARATRATRSARSSRQGGAMTCTPIGRRSPSVHTGTAQTGRPMKEIGWVKRPMFGRTSISLPSSTKVFWPSAARASGVAGASTTSTSRKVSSTRSRYQRRNFCALTTQAPGSIAPAIRRSRTSGSKSSARSRKRSSVQRRALDHGDEIGGGARAVATPGSSTVRSALSARGHAVDRLEGRRLAAAGEIAAEPRDAQVREPRRRAVAVDGLDGATSACAGSPASRAVHRVVGQREVGDGACERAEVIEAGDEREAAGARQPSIGRLQAEYAAQRSGHADRAVGVGAERDRHEAAADRRARAARRAAATYGRDRADCARARHARSRR